MQTQHDSDATVSPGNNGWQRHRPLILKLLGILAFSFAFGFALVPLYDTLCQAIGLNSATLNKAVAAKDVVNTAVDTSRVVTIEFTSTQMPGLPWDIRPLEPVIDLHPGELRTTRFLVHNRSNQTVIGQAVPSVSPSQATRYFQKLDCFCFKQQSFAPGEARELPLTFVVSPQLDANIRELTLAYSFFVAPDPKKPS